MLADGGGLVIFGARAKAVLRDALHLVEEMVAEIEQARFLPVEEGAGLGVAGHACDRPDVFGVAVGLDLALFLRLHRLGGGLMGIAPLETWRDSSSAWTELSAVGRGGSALGSLFGLGAFDLDF